MSKVFMVTVGDDNRIEGVFSDFFSAVQQARKWSLRYPGAMYTVEGYAPDEQGGELVYHAEYGHGRPVRNGTVYSRSE